ncbi:hypothetical protein PInf_010342 [Phytophthora infestans]|nr:hypothetical protein PInf_010342 [Phytophthora infestans]
MPHLSFLHLGNIPNVETLPSLSSLESLRYLTLAVIDSLEEIPSFDGLSRLSDLTIINAPRATTLPSMAPLVRETKERHAQLLTKLSDRHRRHLLRDSAALGRFVALAERDVVAPRHRARDDRDRAGGSGGDTAGAQENAEPAESAFANADCQPATAKPQKKRAAKDRAKLTTPAMEVDATDVAAEAMAIPSSSAAPTEAQVSLEPAVVEIMADLMSNLESDVATRVDNDADTPAHYAEAAISWHEPSTPQASEVKSIEETSTSCFTRRNLVSGDDEDAVGTTGAPPGLSTGDGEGEVERPFGSPTCMVSGDPNLMEIGAEQCTRLNSDEETGFDEEPEEEDDDSGWSEDWSLGELTDEDEVGDPNATMLSDSLCLSAARNKKVLKNMRKTGWEYDPDKFGPDPTYADLYDGPFGPSESVMAVAEDPLALMFYFLPPRLWLNVTLESNNYQSQTLVHRARGIRDQQRTSGRLKS